MPDIPPAAIAAAESAIRDAFPGEFGKPGMPEPDALARAALEAAAPLLAEAWGAKPDDELRRRFAELRHDWHAATLFESNLEHIILDLSYQQIIGLGPRVVPLVLEDLAGKGGHWFWALLVLTGNDEARGEQTMEGARQAWLRWGRGQGLIPEVPSA